MTLYSRFSFGRIHFFTAILVVLIISIACKLDWRGLPENENPGHANFESPTGIGAKQVTESGSYIKKDSPVPDNKSSTLMASSATLSGFSPTEMNQIEAWFASHGNFMFERERGQYASYSMETLKQLSDSGDIRALHELTKLYLNKENSLTYGFDAAVPLYWKAAAYGSTNALIELGIITDAKYRFGVYPAAEKQQANLEVLSLYEAAAMRGDKWGELVYEKSMISSSGLDLTESDKEFINKRSQEIYNQIQQNRYEMGLGQFDNSVPDVISHFFKEINNSKR